VAAQFLAAVLSQDKRRLSRGHFSVDGTVAGSLGEPQELPPETRFGCTPGPGHNDEDGRTTRHPGYAISQRIRKRFGLPKVDWQFTFAMAAYDLVRLPKLLARPNVVTPGPYANCNPPIGTEAVCCSRIGLYFYAARNNSALSCATSSQNRSAFFSNLVSSATLTLRIMLRGSDDVKRTMLWG
jgi:hypothetical protein